MKKQNEVDEVKMSCMFPVICTQGYDSESMKIDFYEVDGSKQNMDSSSKQKFSIKQKQMDLAKLKV